MVTLNYQTFGNNGFQLRLRLYQDGETKYINVTKILKGAIQRKHWNQKKQYFLPSCPFASENNNAIAKFKKKYEERVPQKNDIDGMQLICIYVNQPDIMNIQHFRHSVKLVLNKLLFGIPWHYHLQLIEYGVIGTFFGIISCLCYNGNRGFIRGKRQKYCFYLYYPLLLMIICLFLN